MGHRKQLIFLDNLIKKDKISQSYIFSGPESVGKFMVAKDFALKIIDGSDEKSPDLMILKPEISAKKAGTSPKEKEIKIESIREIQKELALFPYSGKFRVVIINNAHRLNKSSQNALLKTIEEPNPTSVVILVTHEEDKLLSTVKSRCQKISFSLVPLDEIRKEMLLGQENSEELAMFSMGRPGIVSKMIENKDELAFRKETFRELKKFFSMNISERMSLAEIYSKDIIETEEKMKFWMWILRAKAYQDIGSAKSLAVYEAIQRIEKSLDTMKGTNANSRLVLENLMINL